ncbi:alpha/beta hydrolase family protein [Alicyclobacillus ferrooxydans]|uniref:alpha/beta hydrolase family protein n=1 Tax=Alicyclobacillus ferrooxydans TaxID=471514 RepID=UPI0006D54A02|nr:prolyl oligopeptidase family serine peptidase [Alicyclobacillus ferrooxydans]
MLVSSDVSGVSRAGILTIETGAVQWLGAEGVEEHPGRFSDSGDWLFTVQNVDATLKPVLYQTKSGDARTLKLPAGLAQVLAFVENDAKLIINLTASNRRAELILYDLASDTYEILLPADYGSIDPSLFVEARHIRYPSADGSMVPAILWLPHDIQPGDKLPALLYIHGGPTSQWFQAFDSFAQLLVSRGFAVLMPNPRDSTGYGVTGRDACIKDWGGKDLDEVAAGAEYLAELDFIDKERMSIYGVSYGGYMTYIAATKRPELFEAAIAYVGITDQHKLYEEDMPHFQYYLRQQMGDPVSDHDLWRDRRWQTFSRDGCRGQKIRYRSPEAILKHLWEVSEVRGRPQVLYCLSGMHGGFGRTGWYTGCHMASCTA